MENDALHLTFSKNIIFGKIWYFDWVFNDVTTQAVLLKQPYTYISLT